MSIQPPAHATPASYLAYERQHNQRHALVDGQIVQQAGGWRQHALLSMTLVSLLYAQVRTNGCSMYGSDMRVSIPAMQSYVYPDISVSCQTPQFEDTHEDSLLNPVLLIEVLSPSTERYDRGRKFQMYQTIESFREYLLVAQDAMLVEHFVRHSDKLWSFEVLTDPDAIIALDSIQSQIRLADLYEQIQL